jgi:hypothetical protein
MVRANDFEQGSGAIEVVGQRAGIDCGAAKGEAEWVVSVGPRPRCCLAVSPMSPQPEITSVP